MRETHDFVLFESHAVGDFAVGAVGVAFEAGILFLPPQKGSAHHSVARNRCDLLYFVSLCAGLADHFVGFSVPRGVPVKRRDQFNPPERDRGDFKQRGMGVYACQSRRECADLSANRPADPSALGEAAQVPLGGAGRFFDLSAD